MRQPRRSDAQQSAAAGPGPLDPNTQDCLRQQDLNNMNRAHGAAVRGPATRKPPSSLLDQLQQDAGKNLQMAQPGQLWRQPRWSRRSTSSADMIRKQQQLRDKEHSSRARIRGATRMRGNKQGDQGMGDLQGRTSRAWRDRPQEAAGAARQSAAWASRASAATRGDRGQKGDQAGPGAQPRRPGSRPDGQGDG